MASEILTKKTADGRGAAGEGDLEVDEGDFLSSPVIGTSGGDTLLEPVLTAAKVIL